MGNQNLNPNLNLTLIKHQSMYPLAIPHMESLTSLVDISTVRPGYERVQCKFRETDPGLFILLDERKPGWSKTTWCPIVMAELRVIKLRRGTTRCAKY